ncbi:hypothetical protein SDC9_158077 [bioreactor metagenome]|uniref:Uncharacterized protein n=1 Tax=bioreactor metagenome TaxID=1076179 RepID=A0A645FA47_9ZZZZ
MDTIHQAIAKNCQISFLYFEYTVDKEKSYRHGGEAYVASPYALSWDDENYYMIAYYKKYDDLSHFRVDKMESIEILEEKCINLPNRRDFNPAEYAKKVFNMFGGREENIRLQFDNSLINVVLDRFGEDISIYKADENSFTVHIRAFVSPTLLGWIFEFGNKVKILSPQSLIDKIRQNALDCLSRYQPGGNDGIDPDEKFA